MNELTLDGKIYVSSKRAAEISGYAKDYVGQLCREGRVEARLVGRNWYILKTAIEKHRFASEAVEKEVPEPVAKDFTADTWVQPTYIEAELPDLRPTIDEAPHEVMEAEAVAPVTTVEAMQDAWHGWFNQINRSNEEELPEEEIALEPTEEPQSDETAVPLRSIASAREQPEVLNLRRIREYQPEEEVAQEEPLVPREKVLPKRSGSRGYYRTIQAVCVVVALLAVGVAYIAAGFAGQDIISHKPASSIAGVSVYNKAQ